MLSCDAPLNLTHFARQNPSWRASDLIESVETIRSRQRVPFYLYDAPTLPHSVADELSLLEQSRCRGLTMWSGEYWFLKQLLRHPWRVGAPAEADILVIPSLVVWSEASAHMRCVRLTPFATIMSAVYKTTSWQERRHDHMWGSMLWTQGNAATGMNAPILRLGVETRYNKPMLYDQYASRPPLNGSSGDWLIAAPYVDPDTGSSSPWAVADPVFNGSDGLGVRGTDFFFGGRTSTRIGPGRAQMGYYARWWLMRQWAMSPSSFRGTEIVDSDDVGASNTARSFPAARVCEPLAACRESCNAFFKRGAKPGFSVPACTEACVSRMETCAVPSCNPEFACRDACGRNQSQKRPLKHAIVPGPASSGPPHDRVNRQLAITICEGCLARAQQGSGSWNTSNCLPLCRHDGSGAIEARSATSKAAGRSASAAAVRASPGSACLGRYTAGSFLRRARFSLCLRGDVPSSPRPYEAIRFGAIPVIVSDHLWRIGIPFQCLVPWRLMTISIAESVFATGAAAALRAIADDTLPAAERRMRELIAHFGRDVLWRHPASRVAENALLEAARVVRQRRGMGHGCCPLQDEILD